MHRCEIRSMTGFLFVLLTVAPAFSDLNVLPPESVQLATNTSIFFYKEGENGYYGNNVTSRAAYLPDSANKVFFDFETILPNGTLKKFYFATYNYSTLDNNSTRIRLQIWRPVDLTSPSLMLVWQQLVQIPTNSNGVPKLYTYAITEAVALVYGDRIGWAFEGNSGPISYQYVEQHRTYFSKVDSSNPLPDVGQSLRFDSTFFPTVWSVAVLVDGSPNGATGSTGPPGSSATSTPSTMGATESAGPQGTPRTPEASNASIIFYKEGENGYYGNNVTFRTSYLPTSANKAFFDYETILPSGTLRKFYFATYNYNTIDSNSTRIRLQIWRPVDLTIPRLMLVWQQLVQIPTIANGVPKLYTYAISETVELMNGDRIGWAFEGDTGPICFQFVEQHRTYLFKVDSSNPFPDVGQSVDFDKVYLPSQWSVAVLVDESPNGATGPIESPGSSATSTLSTTGSTQSAGLQGTTASPEASNTSIVFYKEGENGYYGNNVTFRSSYLAASANKAFFDYETILPSGTLKKFYFMTYNYSSIDSNSTRIRLQIWRPVNLTIPRLMLVWQQLVQIPTNASGVPKLYTYAINEAVSLMYGDRIGWAFEGDSGPISFQYSESHRTYFLNADSSNPLPDVGQSANFNPTFLPSVWSVAVLVDGTTGSTGPPGSSPTSTPSATESAGPQGTTGPPTASNTSIIFYKEGENGYYGNNVTFRDSYLPRSANKAFFDYGTFLPSGTLKKFYFMTYNYSTIDSNSTRIRLQIWRPVDLTIPRLMLVWQHLVQIPTNASGVPKLYTYSINESVALMYGDRIGWAFEGDIGPISFQYDASYRTYLFKVDSSNPFPDVGQSVNFDKVYLPSQWSVAVLVDGATGPTGPPGSSWATSTPSTSGTSWGAGPQVLAPESVQIASNTSIIFYREGQNGYYGNNVTLRFTYLPDSANKVFFDFETILPSGTLKKFYFTTHNYSTIDNNSTRIRLQIWRPVDLTSLNLMLVWQQLVQIPTNSNGVPKLYTYAISEEVSLMNGDRIGWAFEGDTGPISYQYVEQHRTYFSKVDSSNPLPEVGQSRRFDSTFLPSVWSVAVLVDGSSNGATGPSGPPGSKATNAPQGTTELPDGPGPAGTSGYTGSAGLPGLAGAPGSIFLYTVGLCMYFYMYV